MKDFYVYILKCSDGSYYTGLTNNLEKRLIEHNKSVDRLSYTYTRRPVKLVFSERFNDFDNAMLCEKQIKGWSRKKKEALINKDYKMLKFLAECKNRSHSKNK